MYYIVLLSFSFLIPLSSHSLFIFFHHFFSPYSLNTTIQYNTSNTIQYRHQTYSWHTLCPLQPPILQKEKEKNVESPNCLTFGITTKQRWRKEHHHCWQPQLLSQQLRLLPKLHQFGGQKCKKFDESHHTNIPSTAMGEVFTYSVHADTHEQSCGFTGLDGLGREDYLYRLDKLYYGEYMNNGPGSELDGLIKWPSRHHKFISIYLISPFRETHGFFSLRFHMLEV